MATYRIETSENKLRIHLIRTTTKGGDKIISRRDNNEEGLQELLQVQQRREALDNKMQQALEEALARIAAGDTELIERLQKSKTESNRR